MKFTVQELSDLTAYLQKIYPDITMRYRKDHEDVLEFNRHGLLFYKAVVNVGRDDGQGGIKTKKEPVYFLETPEQEIRKTPGFEDIIFSLVIFCVAEDLRKDFDVFTNELSLMHSSGDVQ